MSETFLPGVDRNGSSGVHHAHLCSLGPLVLGEE